MPGKFKLNTGVLTTLKQVVGGLPSGETFDFKATEAAGVVTLANARDQVEARKWFSAATAFFTET